jgi:hypothetical protein
MIRISFRAARDKDVYLITQNPHDETRGYVERLRHEIHNLLPFFQDCVWNPRFRTMALRKQNLVPPGRYLFHQPPCFRVTKRESLIFRSSSFFWETTLKARKNVFLTLAQGQNPHRKKR